MCIIWKLKIQPVSYVSMRMVIFCNNDLISLLIQYFKCKFPINPDSLLVCSLFALTWVVFLCQGLTSIITYCLEEAEKLQMSSLSFPAIGTGNLSFPRAVVSRVLLKEIHSYSRSRTPRHLREVVIVVHPSDGQTVDVSFRSAGESSSASVWSCPETLKYRKRH